MLQSSIYPESYGVASEYFFVIKFLFNAMPELKEPIKLMKIHLDIQDRNKNKDTKNDEKYTVKIDRKLKGENKTEGLVLTPNGPKKEHNILLYVENLKAKVTGYVEYVYVIPQENEESVHKINIKEFQLDLNEGQFIVKNHTFKEFWNSVAEVEEMLKSNHNMTTQQLQD